MILLQKMSFPEVVDLSSDDEPGEVVVNVVKQEPVPNTSIVQHKRSREAEMNLVKHEPGLDPRIIQHRKNNLEAYASKLPPAPICRQFWKAGNYDDSQASKLQLQGGQNHLSVNPKFLHSNATSHKWAFGAVAELLDNAFDEVQNGASFVVVDKIINQRDGCPALLIHDNGGGMDPESMRRCMSFGFSAKKSKSAIGQYGNGFKTSTMRLGADVIVFSRHTSTRLSTQSVGLLSYSFLRRTGHDRIVVPMVDYEFEASTGKVRNLRSYSSEQFSANLSIITQWSPYESEAELLKQFDNMGPHGTKVIIYNLWFNDAGDLELDFETDPEDILLTGAPKIVQSSRQGKMTSQYHIANRFPYSLRVYSSILYLRIPKDFSIILRGRVVDHHNIANDLKFPEFILYKPQIGGNTEAAVVTTIGFLKDAPHVNIHGFSVYHKNRLIMPFWRVLSQTNSRGRGVAGVLEANFIEPTHNKQEFEKTNLFQKLEARLKDMTLEYWDFHCGLIGYKTERNTSAERVRARKGVQPVTINPGRTQPVTTNPGAPTLNSPRIPSAPTFNSPRIPSAPTLNSPRIPSVGRPFHDGTDFQSRSPEGRTEESVTNRQTSSVAGIGVKRKGIDHTVETERLKRRATAGENATNGSRHQGEAQPASGNKSRSQDREAKELMQENKKLRAQCLQYEKSEEELNHKVERLKLELLEFQHEYARLMSESKALEDNVKDEKT